MQRVARADRDAFNELYASSVAVLFSFARRVLKDPADIEEVICDSYIQAWQSAKLYNPERGSAITWLVMICRARAIDRYRQNHSRLCAASSQREPLAEPSETDAGPYDLLTVLQKGSAIHFAIERLSPVRQRLLALTFFRDLTNNEIAEATNLAEGTVKSHIRRAVVTLQKDLRRQSDWRKMRP